MSVADYRKTMRSLQAFVIAAPLLSKIFDHHSDIPFPPLGDETMLYRFFAMLLIGTAAALPYVIQVAKKRLRLAVVILFCLAAVSSGTYLMLEQWKVVPIHFPASEEHPDGAKTFVTRGERNPELKEPYASMYDEDLIEHTGQSDSRLERVYTKRSLLTNRLELFAAYIFPLVCIELALGFIAKSG